MRNFFLPTLGRVAHAIFVISVAPLISQAESVAFSSRKDASIYANSTNHSSGGGPGIFSGGSGSGSPRRGLIAFDVATHVPAGATVTAVELGMYLGQAPNSSGVTVDLRRLLGDWGEGTVGSSSTTIGGTGNGFAANPGDATWSERFSTTATWTAPGALDDTAAVVSASAFVNGPVETGFTWNSTPQLVGDVQGWLDAPSTNFGWLLVNAAESSPQSVKAFYSRSASQNASGAPLDPAWRPMLNVTYTMPGQPNGDYDGNGVVDAADDILWRETLGQTAMPAGSGADGNQSRAIDPGDYDFWRARFGNVISGSAAGHSDGQNVPEPALAATVMLAAILVYSQRRR